MARFARIIELEDNEQVLLNLEYNNENYEVRISTNFHSEGLCSSVCVAFGEYEDALEMINNFPVEDAIKFRNAMADMIK